MPHYLKPLRRGRRSRRARLNSPIQLGDSTLSTAEVLELIAAGIITQEEVNEALFRQKAAATAPAPAAERAARGRSSGSQSRSEREEHLRRLGVKVPAGGRPKARRSSAKQFSGKLKDPSGLPSHRQAQLLGKSLGGIKNYCPAMAGAEVMDEATGTLKHLSNSQILYQMGVTKALANEAITALKAAGVCSYQNVSDEDAAGEAREIFERVTGVSCPFAGTPGLAGEVDEADRGDFGGEE